MPARFEVRFLPDQTEIPVSGAAVVMTDVLRASSTIATAIAHGSAGVVPKASIEDAFITARALGPRARIGGERAGLIVDGFDMGNSPLEYRPEVVRDRPLVLCTTNGTWALNFCRGGEAILVGAFVNLGAIAEAVAAAERVVVVCAGTDRKVTGEDVLFAGALAARLVNVQAGLSLSPNAARALALWRDQERWIDRGYSLFDFFRGSRGGRNLVRLNYELDLEYCARIDSVPVVPILDEADWVIRGNTEITEGTESEKDSLRVLRDSVFHN